MIHPRQDLVRTLGLADLVLLNIVAIVGIRWLITAAKMGESSLFLWVLALVFFFIPQGLAVMELSSRFPHEGGIYIWTREAFGPFHGFLCGWCYWVNNLIYYPSLIIFLAGNAAYVGGVRWGGLAENRIYIVIFSCSVLWFVILFHLVGLRFGKWIHNVGAVGTWIPILILIFVAAMAWFSTGPANSLELSDFFPDLRRFGVLTFWATMCFAFAGLELAPVMGGEIRRPERNIALAILISGPIITGIYLLGTLAIIVALPLEELNLISGIVQSVARVGDLFGVSMAPLVALCITIAGLGGVGAWLAGSARIPFVAGADRFLPRVLERVHPRWHTPYVALLVQGALATVFIGMGVLGSTVEEAYLVLLDTTIIVYFIPYLYLFLALPVTRLRKMVGAGGRPFSVPGGIASLMLVSGFGFFATLVSVVLAAVPAEQIESPRLFVVKVVGGTLGFVAIGVVLYIVRALKR